MGIFRGWNNLVLLALSGYKGRNRGLIVHLKESRGRAAADTQAELQVRNIWQVAKGEFIDKGMMTARDGVYRWQNDKYTVITKCVEGRNTAL